MQNQPEARFAVLCLLLILSLLFGTLWHELVGHGVTGLLCGGRISYVEVLGISLWPDLSWVGWQGYYGRAHVDGITDPNRQWLVDLGGSMSTWLVSVVALALLRTRPWQGLKRLILICLGLWWIDLFTYTLPTWGLRRSLLWGGRYSEPYEAAVALGIPGTLFQTFVIVSSVLLATTLMSCCRKASIANPKAR